MGKMLRFVNTARLLCVLAACALLLIGCRDQNPSTPGQGIVEKPKPILIGFVTPDPEAAWFKVEWKAAQDCAHAYGFRLVRMIAPDGASALAAIDKLDEQGAQGFIIHPADVRFGPAIVNRAESKNMLLYVVDDQFLGANGEPMTDVPYIGMAPRVIGDKVGKTLFAELTKREWNLDSVGVCVLTSDGLPTAKDRTDGAVNALKAAGLTDDSIFTRALSNATEQDAAVAVQAMLDERPEVRKWLVFGTNDESVIGAVNALREAGHKADNIIGVGIGLCRDKCLAEFAKKKYSGFFATCLIDCKRHGYLATENLYKWIKDGVQPPMETRTQGRMIYHTTYKDALIQEGLMSPQPPEPPPSPKTHRRHRR